MVLTTYVNQTLDDLLTKKYIKEIEESKKNINSDFVRRTLDADIEIYSKIIRSMEGVSQQFEWQLDPKVNEDLGAILVNFISKALKDNEDPSQLYRKILDAYNQEVFSKGYEALVILLSKIYWEALKTLGVPDPINRQYYRNVSREAKENAAMAIPIVKKLLVEALYKHWSSRGKKITKKEIMANLEEHARPFYAAWEAVKGKIENEIERLTPNRVEIKDAVMKLVDELDKNYISFIKYKQDEHGKNYIISFIPGLIISAYKAGQAPEHMKNVLEDLINKDFFKNVFSEMYNEIENYTNQLQPQLAQYLQQNQPAGQQQGGQQGSQPQQPSQPPAGQQPAHQQQQANQPHQNNQQGHHTP